PAVPPPPPAATIPTSPPDTTSFPSLHGSSSGASPPPSDIATSPLPPFEGQEAATGGGHGAGGHGGAVVENWWSWDYGEGKSHKHPPFGFALINFSVFLLIMARLFGKSFGDFLRSRHTELRRALDRAREVQHQAEKHLRQIEERTRNLE